MSTKFNGKFSVRKATMLTSASYHPDFPPETLGSRWVKVEKDDELMILEIEKAVREFDIEVEDLINHTKKRSK